MVMTVMDNLEEEAHKHSEPEATDRSIVLLSDVEWSTEKSIDEVQCNLASVEQTVTNKSGQTLTIRKYQSQCRKLARWIPIALPTPEFHVYASDLKPEIKYNLEKLHHPEIIRIVLHHAVLRLFEAVGFQHEAYIRIGRKLIVKLIVA